MLTIAIYWIGASYVLGIALAVDQMRRPLPAWEAAGSSRRSWVAMTLVMGFHGLGEFAAVAYLVGVVPRFRPAERRGPRLALQQANAAIAHGWRRAVPDLAQVRSHSAVENLAWVAALLVFVSSCIHSAEIAPHFEQYWLYGVFFAVTTVAQALWAAVVYRGPPDQRVLLAGAVGNAALIVLWAISRTVAIPLGPLGDGPEPVGVLDVLSKLDELGAVVLIVMALRRLRGRVGSPISPLQLRLAAMIAGPLVLYSILAAFGGGGHQH
jgi:hypothetical protein